MSTKREEAAASQIQTEAAETERNKKIRTGYIFGKIGILILMYLFAIMVAVFRLTRVFFYVFWIEYLKFGTCVILYGIFSHYYGEAIDGNRFHFEQKPFAPWKWEDGGRIYQKKFHIRSWKEKLFDASKALPALVPKEIDSTDPEYLKVMLQETCRAEVVHWTIIIFGNLFMAIVVDFGWNIFYCAIYTFYNLSDIMIQRYNRPRLLKMYHRALRRSSQTVPQQAAAV